MLRSDKERVVEELTERLRSAQTLIVADFRGLKMKEIDALRGQLLEHGAKFSVVKNTLTRRAAESAGAETVLSRSRADGDRVPRRRRRPGRGGQGAERCRPNDEDPHDPRRRAGRPADQRRGRQEPRDAPGARRPAGPARRSDCRAADGGGRPVRRADARPRRRPIDARIEQLGEGEAAVAEPEPEPEPEPTAEPEAAEEPAPEEEPRKPNR